MLYLRNDLSIKESVNTTQHILTSTRRYLSKQTPVKMQQLKKSSLKKKHNISFIEIL